MTSYARTTTLSATTTETATKNQLCVLAQAKPAIISSNSSTNNYNIPTGALSEKLNTTLRFSASTITNQEISSKFNGFDQRSMHIEDDNVIQKQNASNQMRQAAVVAAVASQQKVRLSASERLAMTAIRPTTKQELQSKQSNVMTTHNNAQNQISSTKSAPLPTLETLLAVQRQLKQHTKQNLTSVVPQQVVNKQQLQQQQQQQQHQEQQESSSVASSISTPTVVTTTSSNQRNKPLPPSPPKSPPPLPLITTKQQVNHVTSIQSTYDKDLPPLPPSISPCTSTDDSQLNSLESHQSSPATSLVSLPPPPPPLSAYLQQYDEVSSSCQQSNNSSSSSPSIASSTEISSVKHYPSIPVIPLAKQQSNLALTNQNNQISSRDLASPYISPPNQYQNQYYQNHHYTQEPRQQSQYQQQLPQQPNLPHNKPPAVAPKLQNLVQSRQCQQPQFNQYSISREKINQFLSNHEKVSPTPPIKTHIQAQIQAQTLSQMISQNENKSMPLTYNLTQYKPQINYQQHVFTQQTAKSSPPYQPPPPPPPSTSLPLTDQPNLVGFDQLDSGNFRFPTPPPPDLLLDEEVEEQKRGHEFEDVVDGNDNSNNNGNDEDGEEEEEEEDNDDHGDVDDHDDDDDDDFQCRIPTPPPHKSMSSASFQNFKNARQNIKQSAAAAGAAEMFSSSTFSVPRTNILQPPPSFRQKDNIETLNTNNHQAALNSPPQLTVHINNDGGLLSTANSNHNSSVNHHHHHHMMMTMTTSSSSPSSSSDGDGQSSNSSSSTSGIHSSIDSPSLSNSKLDDFNYSGRKVLNKKQLSSIDLQTNLNKNISRCNGNIISSNNNNNNNDEHNNHYQHQQHHESSHHKNINVFGPPLPVLSGMVLSNSVSNSNSSIATASSNATTTAAPTGSSNGIARRPALKQKKSVSFSDKVELVACAEEQSEDHLPNPLLARVLAGKLQ